MNFDLNSSIGEWFPFFTSEVKADGDVVYGVPDSKLGRVCLRIADAETLDRIHSETRKKVSENVYNPKTRGMERIAYIDQTPEQEKKERELIWDHAIIEWDGMLDKNGNPIPCTLENKLKLMNIPVFARFIGRCLQLIGSAEEQKKEESAKN